MEHARDDKTGQLECQDLLRVGQVCRRWRTLSEEGILWKSLLESTWPRHYFAHPDVVPNSAWKRLYRSELNIDLTAKRERARRLDRSERMRTWGRGVLDITVSLVGDPEVGKTCLASHFASSKFMMEYIPTIEDCHVRTCMWMGRRLALRLCDTSGSLEDKVNRDNEWPWGFSNVDIFLCCFDVTSFESLEHVKSKWAPLVRKLCLDVPIILCGLKAENRYLIDDDANGEDEPPETETAKAIPVAQCEQVKEEIGAEAYVEFSPLVGDGLTLDCLIPHLPLPALLVAEEEQDDTSSSEESSSDEDDNTNILQSMLTRQNNRRAETNLSDEEYESW